MASNLTPPSDFISLLNSECNHGQIINYMFYYNWLVLSDRIDLLSPDIPEEKRMRMLDSLQSKVHQRMKKEVYNWKAIQYEPYK